MRDYSILDRQLHTFKIEEIQELRRVADTIFEPLVRPFRQRRRVSEFSFDKTIRTAQRLGVFMPAYEKVEREHRKSRLVIAISLAGIDRCSAVSLIPLFSCLKETALDFNLYIYTDDLIKAEFTHDGFLANDHEIAWNHVSGPNVMQRLVDLETSSQEDLLLIIDSLGGGDSRWYETWSYEESDAVKKEQDRYLAVAGRYSFYTRIRNQLNGDFSKFKDIKNLPEEWFNRVRRNTQERWMETPALEEYMVRWAFNSNFGSRRHGEYFCGCRNAFDTLKKLRGKFRQIHLLTPNNDRENTLSKALAVNVIDYHHKANTIYGFATVLANIVHGQCPFDGPFTKKVSYEIVKISEFKGEEEDDVEENPDAAHTELSPSGQCFVNCPQVSHWLPSVKTLKLEKRARGTSQLEICELAINEIDLTEILSPGCFNLVYFWKDNILPLDFEIDKGDSEYTRMNKVNEVLETIKNYHIVHKGSGFFGMGKERRPKGFSPTLDAMLKGVKYEKTNCLQNDVEELLTLVSPSYHKFFDELPLKHVIWCSVSKFAQDRLAVSVSPEGDGKVRRAKCWHELGHYLEGVCPPVGAFTNELLRQKGGKFDRKKLVQVGPSGEYAMPVTDGSKDWVKPYAGKWYKRKDNHLPNDTEIVSVHLEYFSNRELLARLIMHDPNMVRFMAFILMGGPVAAFEGICDLRRREALEQISQRDRKASGYKEMRRRGGWRSSSNPKKEGGFGF